MRCANNVREATIWIPTHSALCRDDRRNRVKLTILSQDPGAECHHTDETTNLVQSDQYSRVVSATASRCKMKLSSSHNIPGCVRRKDAPVTQWTRVINMADVRAITHTARRGTTSVPRCDGLVLLDKHREQCCTSRFEQAPPNPSTRSPTIIDKFDHDTHRSSSTHRQVIVQTCLLSQGALQNETFEKEM